MSARRKREASTKPRKRRLTAPIVKALPTLTAPYRVHDTEVPRLFVRVQPSGVKSYNVQWSRASSVSIGKHPEMLPEAARTEALEVLRDAKHGTPEAVNRKGKGKPATLRVFLDDDFEPWAVAHLKWGSGAVRRIKSAFVDRLDKPLTELNAWVIEKWRSQRLKAGKAAGTVNRELATLKSALAKAVTAGLLPEHPLASVKLRRVANDRVRYLDDKEDGRLREALTARDRAGIEARSRGNHWRAQRGHDKIAALPTGGYSDHLTPMVLAAANTGLRRGELTALDWTDIDLAGKRVHVRAAAAKSGKSRYVPLNTEAFDVLKRWKGQGTGAGRVFAVRDVKTAWLAIVASAKIKNFRFHDLRHTFASRLVMAGVDLNTVRELLGQADLTMTLRYAHLAQEHKEAAVELLTFHRFFGHQRAAP